MPVAPPEPHPYTAPSVTPAASSPSAHPADALVAKAAAGDRAAFEGLYRAHVGRVYALCVRMAGDRVAAEELTQDVFVRAWEKLGLFRGESAFSTWLHRLAVNVVLQDRRASWRRERRILAAPDEVLEQLPSPDDRAQARRPAEIDLDTALPKLPPGARAVFVLHDIEGYPHEEIAAMLGVTVGTTKTQLFRARRMLREALG
jgi:RNA polymerase sigma-70 factor (ECF subfamily)